MKKLCIIFIVLGLCVSVQASELKKESHVEDAVEASMEILKKGTIAEFIESLRPIWNKPGAEIDAIKKQISNQRIEAHKRFGATLDVQYINLENVEDILIRIQYIEKFEKTAMRWTFIFYRPDETWYLNSFIWDQNIDVLFNND